MMGIRDGGDDDAPMSEINITPFVDIVLVLLMFLLLPGAMNRILERAGFTKASVAGFEWELQDSVQKTQDATQAIAQLDQRLENLNARLGQISQSTTTPPAVREQITTLSRQVDQTRSETSFRPLCPRLRLLIRLSFAAN